MSTGDAETLVVIGRVGRAHGIRGEINVESRTDEPGVRFAPGSSVLCAGRTLTVRSCRSHGKKLIIALEQVTDRNAAEALHGELIEVRVDPLAEPDGDDEYYDRQLRSLRVICGGTERGRVVDVLHLPGQDVLAVDTGNGEVLVPFVAEIVGAVDLIAGTLEVFDRPGLLDPSKAEQVIPHED